MPRPSPRRHVDLRHHRLHRRARRGPRRWPEAAPRLAAGRQPWDRPVSDIPPSDPVGAQVVERGPAASRHGWPGRGALAPTLSTLFTGARVGPLVTSSRAALLAGGLARGLALRLRALAVGGDLRGGDARLQRFDEVDRGCGLLVGLRHGDLLATHLRLEQGAKVAPVLARQLLGLEVAGETLDDLPGELELGAL